jgi:hypothetical protein
MNGVVVLELSHWQFILGVLLLIDKKAQVLLQLLIDSLSLSISLRVVGY